MVPRGTILLALLQLIERDLLALLLLHLHHLVLATQLHLLRHVAGRACVAEFQALDFSRQRLVQSCSVRNKNDGQNKLI